jgi:hypothetical protein
MRARTFSPTSPLWSSWWPSRMRRMRSAPSSSTRSGSPIRRRAPSLGSRCAPTRTRSGVVDAFSSDDERQVHLDGAITTGLLANGERFLDGPPEIFPAEVLAAKLPRWARPAMDGVSAA